MPAIAEKIHGHPATANYTAYLVNGGRSMESLVLAPDPVLAFQDRVLANIFDSGVLSDLQKRILKLLSWFPKLSLAIICNVLPEYTPSQIVEELWELVEFSLIDQSEKGRYKAPAVVSSTYQRRSIEHDWEILGRFSKF